MELLKEVAHVSGKSGLYHILKPGRAGVIVETLDEKREKTMLGPTARVSVLKEISIFMADGHEAAPLGDILANVHKNHADKELNHKTMSDYEMVDFMAEVAPGYDTERVYLSDIRKLISWYNILKAHFPKVFEEPEPTAEETTEPVAEK